jgi:hypothetical protein
MMIQSTPLNLYVISIIAILIVIEYRFNTRTNHNMNSGMFFQNVLEIYSRMFENTFSNILEYILEYSRCFMMTSAMLAYTIYIQFIYFTFHKNFTFSSLLLSSSQVITLVSDLSSHSRFLSDSPLKFSILFIQSLHHLFCLIVINSILITPIDNER